MNVHIHAPAPLRVYRPTLHCPTCDRRRRMVVSLYEWYGPEISCLSCGERFNEDGRKPRPFMRNWRPESIRRAREHYARWRGRNVLPGDPAAGNVWLAAAP